MSETQRFSVSLVLCSSRIQDVPVLWPSRKYSGHFCDFSKTFLKGVQVEILIEMELVWPMLNVEKKVAQRLDLVLEGKIYHLAWTSQKHLFYLQRFGVCCVFMTSTCSTTVSQNCSYIKNPGYPSAYTSTSSCQFTIDKCDSSVCDLRLDFERFTTNGPAPTDETSGGLCQDILTTTVNTGQVIPEICGENSGQHSKLSSKCSFITYAN